jgi:hypothetical protein
LFYIIVARKYPHLMSMLKSEKAGIINIFIKLYVPFTRKILFDGQQSVSSPPACAKFHFNAEFTFLQKKKKKTVPEKNKIY